MSYNRLDSHPHEANERVEKNDERCYTHESPMDD